MMENATMLFTIIGSFVQAYETRGVNMSPGATHDD